MRILAAIFFGILGLAGAQNPLGYSVPTPRPLNPAESSTNPSAQASQRLNPFLGSVPANPTGTVLELTLQGAIERGLKYNLGLVESTHVSADVHADRLRALASLLPQISAQARQAYEKISFKEIGVKLPREFSGVLPPTSDGYGYQDARVAITQTIYNAGLREKYRAGKSAEQASVFSIKDSRDVVVFAVGTAYLQAIASAAKVDAANAQLASARELDKQTADRVKSEVSPEIDSLRAQVVLQSAEQRLANAANQWEKDKLTLARITGLALDQKYVLTDAPGYRPVGLTSESATEEALRTRSDLLSAEANVRVAESSLRAQKAERLPVVSLSANYGGAGTNLGNFNQVYSVSGNIAVPIYTGGRIKADIEQACAELARREAEYADLKGRVAYDVRVAFLDMSASDSGVKVAERNRSLAERALVQSRDRYAYGVTNYLEVVQAEEAVAGANENYIDSLYSFNVAKIALARAMGGAAAKIREFFAGAQGGN